MQETGIGAWLKQRRVELSLTQQQLGQRVGASAITIRKLEANARKPSAEMARALLHALAIPETEREAFLALAATAPDERHDQAANHSTYWPHNVLQLIGREDDIAAVLKLWQSNDARLITLSGPGGVGKTSLAREVAQRVASQKRNVVWVELAPLLHVDQVLPAIARALGMVDMASGGQVHVLQRIVDYVSNAATNTFANTVTLLVLDNAEHVLGSANEIAELLNSCPKLTMLVTSRAPLRVPGERRFAVSPLPPGAAQQLFTERVREADPHCATNASAESAIRQLCTHLDGLPLAIELVAARATLMTPQAMLAHFVTNDAVALPFIADGVSNLPARQRTLQTSIQWSLDLLDDNARRAFRFLGVFVDAFALDAAVRVACLLGAVEEAPTPEQQVAAWNTLTTLLEANLLVRHAGDEPRFGMLETLQAAAQAGLMHMGEGMQARERHLHYFLSYAEACAQEFEQTHQVAPLQAILAAMPDILAATDYALAQGWAERACRLCTPCAQVWADFGYFAEGVAMTERALALPVAQTPEYVRARAGALLTLVQLSVNVTDQGRVIAICDEALALCRSIGDVRGTWLALHQRAWLWRNIKPAEGWAMHVELLESARRVNDAHWIAIKLTDLAVMSCYDWAEYAAAVRYADEALPLFEAMSNDLGLCYTLNIKGAALRLLNRLDEASEVLEHSRMLSAHISPLQRSHLEDVLGMVCLAQGNLDAAVAHFAAEVRLYRQIGLPFGQYVALANQGLAEVANESPDAEQHLSRALAFFDDAPDSDSSSAVAKGFGARCRIGLARLAVDAGHTAKAEVLLRAARAEVDKCPTAFNSFEHGMLNDVEARLGI